MEILNKLPKENKTGIYKISEDDYFGSPEMSNSTLNNFIVSPMNYQYSLEHPFKATPAMMLGSLVHTMYLEPDSLSKEFVRGIKVDKRTKLGKQMWAEFETENVGRKVVPPDVWDTAETMIHNLMCHSKIGSIDTIDPGGYSELSFYWEMFGLSCRGRLDRVNEDGWITDLKTTKSLSDFSRSILNFGYHRQAGFYAMGVKALLKKFSGFKFIVVENKAPYDCAVFTLCERATHQGASEVRFAINQFKDCKAKGDWPGMFESDKEDTIDLPNFYYKELEQKDLYAKKEEAKREGSKT